MRKQFSGEEERGFRAAHENPSPVGSRWLAVLFASCRRCEPDEGSAISVQLMKTLLPLGEGGERSETDEGEYKKVKPVRLAHKPSARPSTD
jgi:hypothetical protein